ncbi:MAG: hypothetical protein LBE08_07790 [Bifidobacteriaceae bacterium]|nr:hypothetical protein [Bifidobacteriaceae bacterium]
MAVRTAALGRGGTASGNGGADCCAGSVPGRLAVVVYLAAVGRDFGD